MPYKSILLNVPREDGDVAMDVAAELAAKQGARLTGLYIADPVIESPSYVVADAGWIPEPEEELQARIERTREHAAAAERHLRERAAVAGVAEVDWRFAEGDSATTLCRFARCADLLVMGQVDPDRTERRQRLDLPGEVALAAGRPLLVVPYTGQYAVLGTHALIAWNGSRDAARAVYDAMPLLEKSERVTVLAVNAPHEAAANTDSSQDLIDYLAVHGVSAQASKVRADDIDVGNLLLSRAADLGADLLVMGAYGHSRLRELVFGGVTRRLLSELTLPALMSH